MERGQTHRQTDTQTIRLLDQLGPEGRVGENIENPGIFDQSPKGAALPPLLCKLNVISEVTMCKY